MIFIDKNDSQAWENYIILVRIEWDPWLFDWLYCFRVSAVSSDTKDIIFALSIAQNYAR